MHKHFIRNYRIISVMFWAFPYLLWQTTGHWSGFFVGVIIAVILTSMFNGLFHGSIWNMACSADRQTFRAAESQSQRQEAELYQRGYQAEIEPYRAGMQPTSAGERQPQYEEMHRSSFDTLQHHRSLHAVPASDGRAI
jgi:hypothetical protein